MESDLLCFIPEYFCSGFAEHIFKGVGCCAIKDLLSSNILYNHNNCFAIYLILKLFQSR